MICLEMLLLIPSIVTYTSVPASFKPMKGDMVSTIFVGEDLIRYSYLQP